MTKVETNNTYTTVLPPLNFSNTFLWLSNLSGALSVTCFYISLGYGSKYLINEYCQYENPDIQNTCAAAGAGIASSIAAVGFFGLSKLSKAISNYTSGNTVTADEHAVKLSS